MFIGTLDELLHKGEFALKAKVRGLDWSTTSLSEQKLEIGKAGVKMKNSDMKEDVKMDELRIKEGNKEMKEFGMREPDLMIKGEDTKKGGGLEYLDTQSFTCRMTTQEHISKGSSTVRKSQSESPAIWGTETQNTFSSERVRTIM